VCRIIRLLTCIAFTRLKGGGGGGGQGTPYNGIYREAPPKRSTFFRLKLRYMKGFGNLEMYDVLL